MIKFQYAFIAILLMGAVGCSDPGSAKALTQAERPLPIHTAIAQEVDMPLSIPILGTMAAESRSNIGSEIDGRVIALLVHEGDHVKAGDPLIQLSENDARALLGAAKGGLQQAILSAQADEQISEAKLLQARLDFNQTQDRLASAVSLSQSKLDESQAHYNQLKRGPRPQEIEAANSDVVAAQLVVESNQSTADFTELILKRKSGLLKEGGISQNEVDQATLDHNHAVQSVQFAQQQLRAKQLFANLLKEGTPKEELAEGAAQLNAAKESLRAAIASLASLDDARQTVVMAEADHNRAAARLQQVSHGSDEGAKFAIAQQDLLRTQIKSPIDGIVASIKVVKGQVARAGQVVAEVIGQGGLRMEATAMDQDIGRILKGQSVTATTQSTPSRTYHGFVQDVLPPGSEGRTSRILISLSSIQGLSAGAVVNGQVLTSAMKKVVTIPASAVYSELDSEADVYVVSGNSVRVRSIQLSSSADGRVVVASGLMAGEEIVLNPAKELHDGSSVTVTEADR